jgi:integrase
MTATVQTSTTPAAARKFLSPNMLRSLKPVAVLTEYPDDPAAAGSVRGLALRVTPVGTRTWFVRLRATDGKQSRFNLGTYPTMGLAEARTAAGKMQQEVRTAGRNPIQEARESRARAKVQGDGTLAGLVSAYFDKEKGGRGATKLRTAEEQKTRILAVFDKIKDRPLPSLTPDILRKAVQDYPSKGVAGAAAAYLKAVLRRLGENDPHLLLLSTKLKRPEPVGEASRNLTETEVKKLLLALPDAGTNSYGDAIRFYLWTGARRSEVTGMRWQEIDASAGEWTVPKDRMKSTRGDAARKAHMRKLPRQALALLAARQAAYAEASATGAKAPRPEALVLPTAGGGGELGNWDRWLKSIREKAGVADFSLHDLRRTAATMARSLGTSTDTIDKGMLAHTPPKLQRIYIHDDPTKEAGAAMQKLADLYDMLTAEDVVQLKRA